jgi:hypothetical protein
LAAQDNASKVRGKCVQLREQLDTLSMSLRICPPSALDPSRGENEGCAVPLSRPFREARLSRDSAGCAAASEAADEADRAPVPYEVYAQLEKEVSPPARRPRPR